jgi:hypothetical protein
VQVLHRKLCSSIGTIVTRFTKATITSTSGECTQFYAHPCFQGHHWYDWALVHFKKWTTKENRLKITTHQKYLVLSLLKVTVKLWYSILSNHFFGVQWKDFFVKMKLGMDFNISFVMVPIEALVHPLCVIPDCSGDSDIYFVVLPTRNWSRFFGERIIITSNI